MTENPPFGLALYEELKQLGHSSALFRKMSYAQIQQLKAASRDETLKLFQGSYYEVIQHIKRDTPAELALYLVEQAKAAERQQAACLLFMGMMIGG